MCLVYHRPLRDDEPKEGYGWKVFYRNDNDRFVTRFGRWYDDTCYVVGHWNRATYKPEGKVRVNYNPGFHVYLEKPKGCKAEYTKVKYRGAYLYGMGQSETEWYYDAKGTIPCVVAKEMRILPRNQQD